MRVAIDKERCSGHAQCSLLAPTVFAPPGDDGTATALDDGRVAPSDEEAARFAALECPEQAVIIEE